MERIARVSAVASVLGTSLLLSMAAHPASLSNLWESMGACRDESAAERCFFTAKYASVQNQSEWCAWNSANNQTECRIFVPCREVLTTSSHANASLTCQFGALETECEKTAFTEYCDDSFLLTPSEVRTFWSLTWTTVSLVALGLCSEAYLLLANKARARSKADRTSMKVNLIGVANTVTSVLFMTGAVTLTMALLSQGSLTGEADFWGLGFAEICMFSDKLLGICLLLAAAVTVAWPAEPIFATHLLKRLEALQQEASDYLRSTADGSSVRFHSAGSEAISLTSSDDTLNSIIHLTLTGDIALLIHGSPSLDEGTLVSALAVFPPSHIYVFCQDPAAEAARFGHLHLHESVNFLVPVSSDKIETHDAFDRLIADDSRFNFVMQIDSGVRLPGNMHFPKERLKNEFDISQVHLSVRPENLVDQLHCHRASLFELLKDQLASASSCFCEASLWRKGRLDSDKTVASLQTPVSIASVRTGPTASIGSLIWQVLDPNSFRRRRGLGLAKVFALYQLISAMFSCLRPFFFAAISTRGFSVFLVALALQAALAQMEFVLVELVLMRKRPDLRMPLWTVFIYPFIDLIYELRHIAIYLGLDMFVKLRQRRAAD